MSTYSGEPVDVRASIASVNIKDKSPSISAENDVVMFEVGKDQTIPGHPATRYIKLLFDKNALFEPKPFIKGENWRLTMTTTGELVTIHALTAGR